MKKRITKRFTVRELRQMLQRPGFAEGVRRVADRVLSRKTKYGVCK